MRRPKIRVLYEYGMNMRPHASASLRLIRPFSYPAVRDQLDVSFGYDLDGGTYDLVFIDRLWKPGVTPQMVEELAGEVHRQGAKLIYWIDDNFRALAAHRKLPAEYSQSFERLFELSDGLVVSTTALKEAFASKPDVVHLPSAVDERIVVRKAATTPGAQLVIGYMGSATHDDDLRMVLPALQAVHQRFPGRLRLQFVGVLDPAKRTAWQAEHGLPVEVLQPLPFESEYQQFMLWFTGATHWDIAIAPLVDNEFTRYKSDIKFLDYAAAGVPGIFSEAAAYRSTVVERQTGLLVGEDTSAWIAALSKMVEDAALRETLRVNAVTYLYQHRTLARCAGAWLKVVQEMLG